MTVVMAATGKETRSGDKSDVSLAQGSRISSSKI